MDDDDDRWILEFLLVAGFVTGVVVITLCLSIYYVCCYRPKANRRKTIKSHRQQQQRQPSVAIVSVESHRTADSHQQTDTQSRTGDVAAHEFPAVVSMAMEHDVRSAPPPYYATERDLPPPYSIIDAPSEIITEVNYNHQKPAFRILLFIMHIVFFYRNRRLASRKDLFRGRSIYERVSVYHKNGTPNIEILRYCYKSIQ